MKIKVLDDAHKWFQTELELGAGSYVHFFGKYGGKTNVHDGFSTGMRVERPEEPLAVFEKEGITYFVEHADDWFFSGYDLTVGYDEHKKEPIYFFQEEK